MPLTDQNIAHEKGTGLTREYLSQIMREARHTQKLPAIAVTVMNSQALLFEEVQGQRSLETQDQATLDDFFHIGSCSKSVLAVIAAKLIEENKIAWSAKFFDLFPEFMDDANPAYQEITLEDLFLCQAGIRAFTSAEADPFPEVDSSAENPKMEFIRYLVKQPPSSEIKNGRFQHLYSNASYTMASAMLERVSNSDYEHLVTQMISDDLGLSVHIGWPNTLSADQPWGHMITKGRIEAFPPGHDYSLPYQITPAGDLSMTPRDYAKYTQLHLRGLTGADNYITSESYRHIHFGHTGFSIGVVNGVLGGKRFSGFDGSAGTFFCRSIIIPDSDFALTIMTNAGSGSGSMRAVDWLTMKILKKHYNWWWKFWL